jgi:hypothetical protein
VRLATAFLLLAKLQQVSVDHCFTYLAASEYTNTAYQPTFAAVTPHHVGGGISSAISYAFAVPFTPYTCSSGSTY